MKTPKEHTALWELLRRWRKGTPGTPEARCTCDDIGDGDCPRHAAENKEQDRRIAAENAKKERGDDRR